MNSTNTEPTRIPDRSSPRIDRRRGRGGRRSPNPEIPRLGFVVSSVVACTVAGGALAFEGRAQSTAFFQTADGTPFLLVSFPTRSVHWLNLQPLRIAGEQPSYGALYEGLGVAITRASLMGAATPGDTTAGPLAFEKALRMAPCSGSRVVKTDDHIGIGVTFPIRSFARVAQLLHLRSRRTTLTGLGEHLAAVRLEHRTRVRGMPHAALVRRALQETEIGQRFAAMFDAGPDETPDQELDAAVAMRFYRSTHHPKRTINVVVGGFDPKFVKTILNQIFDVPPTTPPTDTRPQKTKHTAPPANQTDVGDTIMLAYPLPPSVPDGTELLVEFIAGSEDAYLPAYLRANGHPRIVVRAAAPFPAPGGLLMIQITDPGTKIEAESPLLARVHTAMSKLHAEPPGEDQLRKARTATRAKRSAALIDQEDVARMLAERWIRTGNAPAKVTSPESVDAAAFQALVKKVLVPDARTTVLPRSKS